jgi:hypothetical protein
MVSEKWHTEEGPGYVQKSLTAYFCSRIQPEKLSGKADTNDLTEEAVVMELVRRELKQKQ